MSSEQQSLAKESAVVLTRRATGKSFDAYPVVAVLNDRWRVIICAAGIQWILQHRGRTETMATSRWRGRSYCQTSDALIRRCREYAGEIEPAACTILAALPARIERATVSWCPAK